MGQLYQMSYLVCICFILSHEHEYLIYEAYYCAVVCYLYHMFVFLSFVCYLLIVHCVMFPCSVKWLTMQTTEISNLIPAHINNHSMLEVMTLNKQL